LATETNSRKRCLGTVVCQSNSLALQIDRVYDTGSDPVFPLGKIHDETY
jgi:hypothetical protein